MFHGNERVYLIRMQRRDRWGWLVLRAHDRSREYSLRGRRGAQDAGRVPRDRLEIRKNNILFAGLYRFVGVGEPDSIHIIHALPSAHGQTEEKSAGHADRADSYFDYALETIFKNIPAHLCTNLYVIALNGKHSEVRKLALPSHLLQLPSS